MLDPPHDALVDRGLVLGRRAEHELDDALLRARAHVHDADGLAVAQDRGPVAERADLQEAVRDEDDRATGLALVADGLEDAVARSAGSAAVISSSSRTSGSSASARARSMTRSIGERARRRASRAGRRPGRRASAAMRSAKASTGVCVRRRFDRTSRSGMSAGSWYTGTRPVRRASAGEWTARSWPRTRMRPRSGRTAPVRILTRVDLPAPLAPMSAWTSPGPDRQRGVRSAVTAPYVLTTPDASRSSSARCRPPRWSRHGVKVGQMSREGAGHARTLPPSVDRSRELLARALAGEELVLGVRGPAGDREADGPLGGRGRVLGRRDGGLALLGDVAIERGVDADEARTPRRPGPWAGCR